MAQATALPVGKFFLLTPWEKVMGIYEDDRAGTICFLDAAGRCCQVCVNITLSEPANPDDQPGMRARSVAPEGFALRLFHQHNGTAWVEVIQRN
jgi:hypothetical protein